MQCYATRLSMHDKASCTRLRLDQCLWKVYTKGGSMLMDLALVEIIYSNSGGLTLLIRLPCGWCFFSLHGSRTLCFFRNARVCWLTLGISSLMTNAFTLAYIISWALAKSMQCVAELRTRHLWKSSCKMHCAHGKPHVN